MTDTVATPAAPQFSAGVDLNTIPKRIGGGRAFNKSAADALLAIVSAKPNATASDGKPYDKPEAARAAAGGAKRLLDKVVDNPETVKTKTYKDGDKYRWVVYLKAATAEVTETTGDVETPTEPIAEPTPAAKAK